MLARLSAMVLLALALTACEPPPVPPDARTTIVSLVNADCADCGQQIAVDLRERPGVYRAQFDRKRAELRVVASPTFDVFHLVQALARAQGFEATLGAGQGRYAPEPPFPPGADAQIVVRDGEDVSDVGAFAVPGKVTVVDFSAPWCRPCRAIDEHMVKVFQGRADVAYRKLDVRDWDSPLARHYLKGIGKLPYVVVYAKDQRRLGQFVGVDLSKLDALLQAGGVRP